MEWNNPEITINYFGIEEITMSYYTVTDAKILSDIKGAETIFPESWIS